MKELSHWASRHTSFAILLIIMGEVLNGLNGVVLGAACLDEISVADLQAGAAVLVGCGALMRGLTYTNTTTFRLSRWCLFGAFITNFLLFGLLGGLMAPRAILIQFRAVRGVTGVSMFGPIP